MILSGASRAGARAAASMELMALAGLRAAAKQWAVATTPPGAARWAAPAAAAQRGARVGVGSEDQNPQAVV
jgi:hypothetical protein